MKKSIRILLVSLCVYLLLLLLLLSAEAGAPDATIHNFGDAVWFSLITMTTVGYGDLSPVTPFGRVLGLIFALCSIGILTALISLGIGLLGGQFLPRMRLRMSRRQKWYVFNEQNPDALTLAHKLQAEDHGALFLFPPAEEGTVKDTAFVYYTADCSALVALRRQAEGIVFFGLSEDLWQNYEQGLEAAALHIPAYCMTDVQADSLPSDLHLFSRSEVLSRSYWQAHPLRREETQVVLIGSGSACEAILERALLINVFEPGRTENYHVFGDIGNFTALHPSIVRALQPGGEDDGLYLHEETWQNQRGLLQSAQRIILCDDIEQKNLRVYGQLHSWFSTSANIHLLLQTPAAGFTAFGDRETMMTPQFIMKDQLNRLAIRMNSLYNRHAAQPTEWNALSEFLRQSNIAAADHLPVKVRCLLGQDSLTEVGPPEYREAYLRYEARRDTDAQLFQEMEHRRWLRFYWMYNWEYSPVRDNALRRHPMMRPYRELKPEDQKKDAYAWELLGAFAEEDPE